jgi:hypothetical protein
MRGNDFCVGLLLLLFFSRKERKLPNTRRLVPMLQLTASNKVTELRQASNTQTREIADGMVRMKVRAQLNTSKFNKRNNDQPGPGEKVQSKQAPPPYGQFVLLMRDVCAIFSFRRMEESRPLSPGKRSCGCW